MGRTAACGWMMSAAAWSASAAISAARPAAAPGPSCRAAAAAADCCGSGFVSSNAWLLSFKSNTGSLILQHAIQGTGAVRNSCRPA